MKSLALFLLTAALWTSGVSASEETPARTAGPRLKLAMVTTDSRQVLFWGAVTWALFIEAMLLLTPYTSFFGLPLNARFIFLTVTAHLVFGLTLGWWCRRRMGPNETCASS